MGVDSSQSQTKRSWTCVHSAALRCPRVFGVLNDRNGQLVRCLERIAHDAISQNGTAIITYCDSTGFDQFPIIGELLAIAANRRRSDGTDLHACAAIGRLHPSRDLG